MAYLPVVKLIGKAVPTLAKIGKELIGMSKERRKKYDAALASITKASNATIGYYRAREMGKPIDREREADLATLWADCAERFRHFDEDLARRMDLKQHYWLSPETWTDEQVTFARIGLERVRREANYLLRLKVRPSRMVKPFLD